MASNEIEILDADAPVEKQNEIATGRALNRRHFMAALGLAGTATGAGLLSGCNAASTPIASTASTINSAAEINALNFILNFKYLEATFYSFVTQGVDLPTSLTYGSGAITGAPAKLTFTAANAGPNGVQINDLLNEIYFDEINHLTALISLLGSSVVARPAINLAAYGAINATALSPTNAIAIARLLEDLGATVIAGAAQQLVNSSLTFASQMLGAEGFHAGALRLIAIQNPTIVYQSDSVDATEVALADPGTINPTTWAGPTAAGGFFATTGGVYASTNTNSGLGFVRTYSQVLADLYASKIGTPAVSGTTSGGFFPNGVSGVTNTV
jgi:hypothetical protein